MARLLLLSLMDTNSVSETHVVGEANGLILGALTSPGSPPPLPLSVEEVYPKRARALLTVTQLAHCRVHECAILLAQVPPLHPISYHKNLEDLS